MQPSATLKLNMWSKKGLALWCRAGVENTWPNISFSSCRWGWASKDASKLNTGLRDLNNREEEWTGNEWESVGEALMKAQKKEGLR
jgi:hypothetical protein